MNATDFHRAVFLRLLTPGMVTLLAAKPYAERRSAVADLYRAAAQVVALYELSEGKDGTR